MPIEFDTLWHGLILPIIRVAVSISIGMFIATVIEALNWTRYLSKVSSPLLKFGKLKNSVVASFALAFFSSSSANYLLNQSYKDNKISKKELVIANILNSSPSYFIRMPSLIAMCISYLGTKGLIYVALTIFAALMRTLAALIYSRHISQDYAEDEDENSKSRKERKMGVKEVIKRVKNRIKRLLLITIPIYILFYVLQSFDVFNLVQDGLSSYISWTNYLKPEMIAIILLAFTAETGAALATSSALLLTGTVSFNEIIISLLIGNILSSPLRAFRHQFPTYTGIYDAKTAFQLITINQLVRAISLICITILYIIFVTKLN